MLINKYKITKKWNGNVSVDAISTMHPVDIAEILESLESERRMDVLGMLDVKDATEVLANLDNDTFCEVIDAMASDRKAVLLEKMSQDDMVDVLEKLTEERRVEILMLLSDQEREDIQALLGYGKDTAGSIMTKDFVAIGENMTCYMAIDALREAAPDAETIYYVYVTNSMDKLVGVVSLRDLIISKSNTLVRDILNENVISVKEEDDQEEVANIVSKYDLLAIPVTDPTNRLIGIITVDDIIHVIEEEATEDIFKFAAASDKEEMIDGTFPKSLYHSVKGRLPWLILMIFGGMLSAIVLSGHQEVIDSYATLALFMPLIIDMGGNVGTQSSTITVRNLALGKIKKREGHMTILHELFTGFFIGVVCAMITAGILTLFGSENYMIAVVIGLAMWANIVTAATVGAIVPLTFKKVGIDPAVASAPFITTAIDVVGLNIYFTLATVLLVHMA